ncbi:MBL fold metallo-hydrolase [Salinicola avicenniae]|uniref:MBL fold metallo-hydrolase n=1 Tax=Salinicola avicenniae TaxID=2916836 RepID=UPI00207405E2|nr:MULTISPECIES: MBL fold metallo-hydrolase [unclassified Salinicola]
MRSNGFLCATCGIQYPPSETPPAHCAVCEDERQFVPVEGQRWTTPGELAAGHCNAFRHMSEGLMALSTVPRFAIGQRAFLLRTAHGNLLWDCLSLLDEATLEIVEGLGGIDAIVLSHPHYFATMAAWGEAFDCPIYVHAADRDWVAVESQHIIFWEGDQFTPLAGLDVYRVGGHFPGACVLHWPEHGTLLTGDTLLVTPDRMASFMWSYPNNIPLGAREVEHIGACLRRLQIERAYSAFAGREILLEAGRVIEESVQRHCRAITQS